VLILGGDVTGKMIVPVIERSNGVWNAEFVGKRVELKSRKEVDDFIKGVGDSGAYPYETNSEGFAKLSADAKLVKELFVRLMKESLQRWFALAEERLKGTGAQCFVSPGNDDFFELDEVFNSSSFVVNPEEKVVEVAGSYEMITLGYANHTPWNSPREVDESVLESKIEAMAAQVKEMKKAVFNLHVPPIGTVLDQAPKIDSDLKPVVKGGNLMMTDAGSTAVTNAVTKYQPMLGLHGHIHESRGMVKLGRTLCLNPGSEYNTGILRGALCELDGDKVKSHVLTSG